MGIFDIFKKKKELPLEAQQWNKMWNLWTEDKIESPYKELMTYQSEVNNGGHSQYFCNIESNNDARSEINKVKKLLSKDLQENIEKAYKAYQKLEEVEDIESEEILEECDNLYYEKESEINDILEEFSSKIEIQK